MPRDAVVVLAEAAERGETDPLTDPDVRLWIGLFPLADRPAAGEAGLVSRR